jgi:pilus assembly protein CpaC
MKMRKRHAGGARRIHIGTIGAIAMIAAWLTGPALTGAASAAARGLTLGAGSSSSATVALGNTQTLRTRTSYVDLVVGDPEIADAMPLTDRSFYVHGKKLGTTTVSAYDANKVLVGQIEIEVSYNTSRLGAELRRRLPGSNVHVSSINGRIMLSGSVTDAVALDRAVTIARQFGTDVINTLTVSEPQQVLLEVRFIEVSRNAGKALGVQWDVVSKQIHFSTGPAMAATNNTPFASLLGHLLSGGTSADALVQALESKGLARRLAEPNLVAMSGQTASFLAGGEFPFPVPGSLGTVTVEFKKFGVGLSFTPLVLADRLISLKIEPEVSQIDTSATIQTPAGPVPSLVVRRASTTVELRDGQSFAIAGLLQGSLSDSSRQLPWIADVPVLGTLFRSAAFERNETELAIIVTPHLVEPAKPGQKLRTPADTTVAANEIDRFLLGKQELTREDLRRAQARPARIQQGHMLDIGDGGFGAAR